MKPLLSLALTLCLLTGPAAALGGVSVNPTTLLLKPQQRATELTLTNTLDGPVTFDLTLLTWRQPDGLDTLQPTQAVVVAPSSVTLAPGAQQTVRVARLGAAPTREEAYRLLITQRAAAAPGVTTRLQLSLPLFDGIVPAATGAPAVTATRGADGRVTLHNAGPVHLKLVRLETRTAEGWTPQPLTYLLAQQGRILDMQGVQELRWTTEDGKTQTLTVP
ncbi:fimbrial biogenesis chaperone [Deinococcus aquiradiocola]|uniref:Pili assembly chaperone N-terminal domain-containing protein n=1 Tax=Deinococcus aquiradiocola TaxID=393059 RepID=A0A917PHN0_9DEIO|nr:fimbria/pilus periplasmic chaperone [Deinococcus aquiradiocola]GGJ78153.1 hypothetical protein GCM10008939_22640 [Deinococcus aquiradiocola]